MFRERAPSDASLLLPSEAISLRSIPIYPIFAALRTRIIREFYTPFSHQQLRAPDVQNTIIRPIFLFISERAQKACVYICLLNFWEFTRESEQQLGQAEIYKTRASVCELLAIDLLQNYSGCTMNLIQVLTFQFSPDQGSDTEAYNQDDSFDVLDICSANAVDRKRQIKLHTSALGIASRSGAKVFTSSALVQAAAQWIWSGDVVFYGKQIDSDTYYSRIERTPTNPETPGDLELGIELHSFLPNRFGGMFRASRLRVPVYQNCINVFFYLLLLALYSYVLSNRSHEFTWPEAVLFIFALAYSTYEVRQIFSCGIDFYFQSVWNFLDIGIHGIFTTYFIIRFRLLFQGLTTKFAYDLLACNAVLLWPRLLFVLDQYPFFGCLIITLKHMFMDATLFFTMAFVFFVGFYQAFCNLAPQGDTELSPYNILMIMLRIFFGSSYLGFDVAFDFSPWFGPLVMFFYIAITALFLTTILISIFNQSFSTIATNASQEHQFIFTAKVMEFVECESLFPFVPPFSLLQLFFIYPFYPFMTTRNYAFYNRTAIRFVYAPFLLLIYVYERFWLRRSLSSRRKFTRNLYGANSSYVDPTVFVQSGSPRDETQHAPIDMDKSSSTCSCGKPSNKLSPSSLVSNSHDTVVTNRSRTLNGSEEISEQQVSMILARQNDLESKLDKILQALNHERLF